MRTLSAFLVTLLILIGGGVTIDAVLTDRAERGAGEWLAAELGGEAEVGFGTWPVTLWLLAGTVPEVGATLRDVPAGEVSLRRISVELRNVRIEGGAALAFGPGEPQDVVLLADHGRVDAELEEEAIRQLTGVAVRLRDGGALIDTPAGEVAAVAGIENGAVVLRPVGEAADEGEVEPLRFELPPLPGDPRVTRVELRDGVARLSGEVRRLGGDDLREPRSGSLGDPVSG